VEEAAVVFAVVRALEARFGVVSDWSGERFGSSDWRRRREERTPVARGPADASRGLRGGMAGWLVEGAMGEKVVLLSMEMQE